MGCTASKLDNEDTVRRCKERRRLMKEAVFARHHLAAAHADYCRSLRLTGSALVSFAAGEPLSVSDQTPSVFLQQQHHRVVPPSPQPIFAPSPSPSPSPTIDSDKLPHILSKRQQQQQRRSRGGRPVRVKLPHILSESSLNSSPSPMEYPRAYRTYSDTASQSSSVWNWENFYPPSPPDSEFFERNNNNNKNTETEVEAETEDEGISEYDFFNSKHQQLQGIRDEEREEVQCSEWGDHCSTSTTSSSDDDHHDVELDTTRSRARSSTNFESESLRSESIRQQQQQQQQPKKAAADQFMEEDGGGSSSTASYSYKTNGEISMDNMKMVVRHKDLKEIVDAIKDYFDKAAAAGDQVSEMLEIGRAQLDKSFRQLKKTVYHSSSVLSTLSSTWTSKPPLAVKYRLDAASLDEPGGSKSLCSTLERLLAWEKKLYEEVKAREGVKIDHEKKLATLQSQEYKGEDETKLDKTKASIKRLQSLIIVTSQAVTTTSTAIVGLRDSDLIPQLVELCHGFMYMWKSMHQFHEVQNNIVQQVRGLVNQTTKGDSTSELHRQATRDLESAVSAWHSSFCRLIKFQRDFIRSLHGWFKLTLLPVNNDNVNANVAREPSEVYLFCDEWKLALDRVPDTVASEAIKSFINVVHVISIKQSEELKIKKRTETASKELEKKASSLRNIERKYYHSYSMVGIGLPDTGPDNGQVLDARDPLAEKKTELAACQRRVQDEMLRHAKAVEVTRAMTLNNLQTGLPGVFQALTSFSSLFTEALELVCKSSYAIK